MTWDSVHLTDKILYLRYLAQNSTNVESSDLNIVDALVTGSLNNFTNDELSFHLNQSHINYMRLLWDKSIKSQIDNSVIDRIKKELTKI